MRFLFPAFLFALSAVIIPVVIHLFNFRKFKKVHFSNVSFLKDIQQQTSSARKLRDLLLLTARILAIVFLVLAFAKPYIPSEQGAGGFQQQIIGIYIDNSYSMEAINSEGSLLDEAKRRAKEIAASYGLNDRFQLLSNDFEGRHQRLLNYDEFLSAVDEVKISGVNRTLAEVLTRQQEAFSSEHGLEKSVYVVSDFQKNMMEESITAIDSTINLRLVRLSANPQANISVDSVWFPSPVHRLGEIEKMVLQLKNNSDKKAENIPYKLIIDGQQKAIGSISVEARSTSRDTLSFSGLSYGWKNAEVSITDYPVIFDDRFFFTFHVDRQIQILAIHESQPNRYLDAVYQADPFFNVVNVSSGNINYSSLGSYPLIILDNTADMSTGLAQSLNSYVRSGGSLMVFPSLSGGLSGLSTLTTVLATDNPEAVISQPVKVSSLNVQHPIFRNVFEELPKNLDLPVANKYVRYSNLSRTNRQSILELPGRRTFISEYRAGKGRVFLSAVPLDEESGNFVRHSVFVPVMYQAAFLSLRDNRLFYTIGKDQLLESPKITLSPNQTLRLKKGDFEVIPNLRQTETGSNVFISDQIRDQGIYSLIKGDSLLATYAFNDNRSESDLTYATESELKEKIPHKKKEIFSPGKESLNAAIKAVNNGVQLWKLCLILALIFLAAEILIIRFYKPGKEKLNY
ncbi:BatA domain-containing protein [Desertivirga xinjiangensis]|uniref:BatA domain-containing protein n=1 Tax=Desertivirga xinjiangensis TaxID=539206 RepID=UPI00210E99B6|nr:BatA domain-containing protein [Pedobacter xinjiangensis]